MTTMIEAFTGWMLAAGLCEVIRRWWIQHQTPYRWQCRRCHFIVKGTDPVLVAAITERHDHAHEETP